MFQSCVRSGAAHGVISASALCTPTPRPTSSNKRSAVVAWRDAVATRSVCIFEVSARAIQLGGAARRFRGAVSQRRAQRNVLRRATPTVAESGGTNICTFQVKRKVNFGSELLVVGNADALGNWKGEHGARLTWFEGDVWRGEVALPEGLDVEFKFVTEHRHETMEWEAFKGNRRFTMPVDMPVVLYSNWDDENLDVLLGDRSTCSVELDDEEEDVLELGEVYPDLAAAIAVRDTHADTWAEKLKVQLRIRQLDKPRWTADLDVGVTEICSQVVESLIGWNKVADVDSLTASIAYLQWLRYDP
eukprot:1175805-Prorocentrum_minimum.AAC.1